MPDYVTIARWALTNITLSEDLQHKSRSAVCKLSILFMKKKVASLYLLFCFSQKAISL